MYPNLNAELTRYNISHADLAKFLGKSVHWVGNRLCGKVLFDVMPIRAKLLLTIVGVLPSWEYPTVKKINMDMLAKQFNKQM